MEFQLPDYDLTMMLPEIFLFLWALVIIVVDVVSKRKSETLIGYMTLAGLAITGAMVYFTGYGPGFGNMFTVDPLAMFFKVIFLGAAFMAVGSSFGITQKKIVNHRGEYFGLILFSTIGMMFLSSSNELLSLYVGLELTTIPLFVLAAFFKDDKMSVEAGIKYFVIGAFSSALLLFGMSFLYGMAGSTDLVIMKINLAVAHLTFREIGVLLLLSNILIIAGIGFKLALPPFHQWAPDVYEGSPTPIAGFLSVASKAAGLVAFAKIFLNGLFAFYGPEMSPNDWGIFVGVLAILAMIIGNVVAIKQSNFKRMMAYSSIAQVGYIMIGMLSLNEHGLSSVGFYMFAYMFANMGIFGAIAIFEEKSGSCQISSYAGLSKTSPFFAASLSVFLLSLVGIPPLAGFMAKYKVFAAAISQVTTDPSYSWLYWLVGVALLTSVFSLFYYANVIRQMYFSNEDSPYTISFSFPSGMVIGLCLAGVFIAGLYPEPIFEFAAKISASFGFAAP